MSVTTVKKLSIDNESGLQQSDSLLHQLQKIQLEKSGLWILSILNVDNLIEWNNTESEDTVNFRIDHGKAIYKYCQQLPTRLLPFKHNKNEWNRNDVFSIYII